MKILVQKFGGTSVDTPEHRAMAARKVMQAREAGYAPVVVVSAIGRAGAPYATDTLVRLLRDVDPQVAPTSRDLDLIMACGEIISASVFAQLLRAAGYESEAVTGSQAGIVTDGTYGNARIREISAEPLLTRLRRGCTPVVCGFQGQAESGGSARVEVTTLGRGGSDTTAAALGAALKAHAVEIYTDVDGVKSADPDLVSTAPTLGVCSYEEVAEIAHLGAKVVHPRAAELAMDYDLPLWVKSTFSDAPGTLVTRGDHVEGPSQHITGITHTGKIVHVRLALTAGAHKHVVEREVYRMMARAGVNIYLIAFSPDSLSFAVPRDLYPTVRDLLDGMVVPVAHPEPDENGKIATYYIFKFSEGLDLAYSVQRPLLNSIEEHVRIVDVCGTVTENCTTVSVVAQGYHRSPGMLYTVLSALHAAGIAVYQTADSDMSITCLVAESDVERAVKVLHERLVHADLRMPAAAREGSMPGSEATHAGGTRTP